VFIEVENRGALLSLVTTQATPMLLLLPQTCKMNMSTQFRSFCLNLHVNWKEPTHVGGLEISLR
jgi:hypothetical protein